jgi:hypothetical protein
MIGAFFDLTSFIVITPPLLIACVTMHFGAGVHWSVILKDLGVPLGLLMCFIGFVGMAGKMDDPQVVGPATAIMLLTLLYGGTLASIGYFWGFRYNEDFDVPRNPTEVKWWGPLASIIIILLLLIWVMDNAAGLEPFFQVLAFCVFVMTALAALIISSRPNIVSALSQSFLFSAMLNVIIGLIIYYQGDKAGLETALLGTTYSFIAYICLYFLSYKLGDPKTLEAPLMNWHWLEVSGFIIFMFLAPPALKEELLNAQSDAAEKKMELRVEELERQLDELRNKTTQ